MILIPDHPVRSPVTLPAMWQCAAWLVSVEKWWKGYQQGKTKGTGRYTCFIDIASTLFLPGYIQIIW